MMLQYACEGIAICYASRFKLQFVYGFAAMTRSMSRRNSRSYPDVYAYAGLILSD